MESIYPVKESIPQNMKPTPNFTRYACAKTSHLKRRIEVKHEYIKINCNLCDYKAKCKAYLKRHMLTHDIHIQEIFM